MAQMNDKTKRIESKLGVNPVSMRQTKAAKARGMQRKMEVSAARKVAAPAPRATKRGTPVKMPARTSKPVGNMPSKPGNIASGIKLSARPTSTIKATAKPKKPLTPSEKAFLEGQKKKAQITKKTGIYPNTAN